MNKLIFLYLYLALSIAFYIIVMNNVSLEREKAENNHSKWLEKAENICGGQVKSFKVSNQAIFAICF